MLSVRTSTPSRSLNSINPINSHEIEITPSRSKIDGKLRAINVKSLSSVKQFYVETGGKSERFSAQNAKKIDILGRKSCVFVVVGENCMEISHHDAGKTSH